MTDKPLFPDYNDVANDIYIQYIENSQRTEKPHIHPFFQIFFQWLKNNQNNGEFSASCYSHLPTHRLHPSPFPHAPPYPPSLPCRRASLP